MTALLAAAVVTVAALGLLAWRRPLARRLALRTAGRQPADAALAVVGCALATAIITGSLLVGDSLHASMRDRIPARLGPVDLVLRSYDPMVGEGIAQMLLAEPPAELDGTLHTVGGEATLRSATGTVLPDVQLLDVNLTAQTGFGGDPAATGLQGAPVVGQREIVLGGDTAAALGTTVGEDVELVAWGTRWTYRVVGVLPSQGLVGFAGETDTVAHNAFVAPGTIYELAYARELPETARPPEHLVLMSAVGGVVPSDGALEAAERAVRERIDVLLSTYDLEPVKADLLLAADEDAASFTELFVSLGAFAVLAGCALLVTVVTTLAEDRRRTLGVLRAVGVRRADVTGAFVLEGAAYAVAAAAVGALLGVGVARAMVELGGSVLSSAWPGGLALRFAVSPTSVLAGFLGGVLVAVATIAVASARLSRIPVVAALAEAPPAGGRPQRLGLTALTGGMVAVGLVGASGIVAGSPEIALLGTCGAVGLGAVAVVGLLRLRGTGARGRDAVVVVAAVLVVGWGLAAVPLLGVRDGDVTVFIVQGVVLAVAVSVLAVHAWSALGPLVRRIGGPTGTVLRLGLAAPSRQRVRTGAVVLVYTLVVFTLAFSNILSGIFSAQVDEAVAEEGGGYDVVVSTSSGQPLNGSSLAAVDGVEHVATLRWQVERFRVGSSGPYQDWALSGIDAAFVDGGAPPLDAVAPRYGSDEEAWRAVLADPTLAIADVAFLQRGGGPPENNVAVGDTIEVRDPGTGVVRPLEVVGVSAAGAAFSGVMVAEAALVGLVEHPVGNRHYVALAPGVDADAVATGLEQQFLTNGLSAQSMSAVVGEALDRQARFFDLIEAYLALALVIGVAGLGVVTLRSVRERRREVAILRSLGFSPVAVRSAFVVEPLLVAVQGVLAGVGLAVVSASQLVSRSDLFGDAVVALSVPWVPIVVVVAVAVGASLAAAVPAALRACAVPPAQALVDDRG